MHGPSSSSMMRGDGDVGSANGSRPLDHVPDSEGIAGIETTRCQRARGHRCAWLRRRSRRAVARSARRLDLAALWAFARLGVHHALFDLVGRPCVRRVLRVRCRRGLAPPAAARIYRLPHLVPLLVRIVSELAEWVPGNRVDGVARRLPSTTMVAGIKARACAACRNRPLKRKDRDATKNRETTPYWSTSATFPQFFKLAEDVVADVAVVGAGVTGLSAACLLAKPPRCTAEVGWPIPSRARPGVLVAGKPFSGEIARNLQRRATLDVPASSSPLGC